MASVVMNPNAARKALLIGSLVALYAPAFWILSHGYFGTNSNQLNDGGIRIPLPDPGSQMRSQIMGPMNSTLGFEKIFYISMPSRSDRQDAMQSIAHFLNLKFDYEPGVNASTIINKAYPYDTNNPPPKKPNAEQLGCWRAHANLWRKIISEDISTALILEDDIDFSTDIRKILSGVSRHMQAITGAQNNEPYGLVNQDSWDVLSLGHCWNEYPPKDKWPVSNKIIQAWPDDAAPENENYARFIRGGETKRVRVLRPTFVVVCTQAYAVTRAGAERLLYSIGGPGGPLYEALDIVMMNTFRDGRLRGYTATPSIFSQWKYGDWRDSDITTEFDKVEKGSGGDIVRSVRAERKRVYEERNIWKEDEARHQRLGK